MLALGALEGNPERPLEGRAHDVQIGQLGVRALETGEGIARVGGQEPGHVAGLDERRVVQQHPGQELGEAGLQLLRELGRLGRERPEFFLAGGQGEALQVLAAAELVAPGDQELAEGGDQDQAVALPVVAHLAAGGDDLDRLSGRLGLDDAALGQDVGRDLAHVGLGQLRGGEQAVVREAGAQVLQVLDAEHLGLEFAADLVEQILQRVVERYLAGARAHGVDLVDLGKVSPDRRAHGGHVLGGLPGAAASRNTIRAESTRRRTALTTPRFLSPYRESGYAGVGKREKGTEEKGLSPSTPSISAGAL